MAIDLITGQPGHGKTAFAMVLAKEYSDAGREVYAHGIKNLNYEALGWHLIEEPKDWESLPDGSVVVLDECYGTFPNRNPGSKVPPHVDAMARHRHRGFDFILIAQQSIQIDPFLRGLIERHQHVRQTSFIKSKTRIKRWDQFQSNTKAVSADTREWVRPKWMFDFYTSTTLVTTKRSVPMWMRYTLLALVAVVGLVGYLKWSVQQKVNEGKRAATTAGALSAVGRRGEGSPPITYDTPLEYAKAHLPRFGTMPWTAPVFDQRSITADPQLYCMSSLAGTDASGDAREASCTCYTEQATLYEISQPECRRIARMGPVYNPYKQKSELQPADEPPPMQLVPPATAPAASVIDAKGSDPAMREQFRPEA